MTNHYPYLISSLRELFPEQEEKPVPTEVFLEFCSSQLEPSDGENLRKLYVLNDFRNALQFKKPGDPFYTPAYYGESRFIELLEDKEELLPVFRRYYRNRENGVREFPALSEIDEIAAYFFEELSRLNNGFLVSYFAFELDLRNITTAISAEKMGIDYANKMIPFGRAYGIILENGTAGDALKQEFDYSSRLLEVFGSPDVVAMEREIDAIRWAWLDEATEKDGFSADSVLAYALKLQVLHRWANLEEEKGRKLFDDLVGIIKRSIRFSIEFSTAGEKKQ